MVVNSLFDVIKNITTAKDASAVESKHFSAYMVNRFLSMDESYFPIASAANRFSVHFAPKRYQELFFFHAVPKRKVFLKYVKGDKDSEAGNISSIVEETGVSDKKASEILAFVNKLNLARNGL